MTDRIGKVAVVLAFCWGCFLLGTAVESQQQARALQREIDDTQAGNGRKHGRIIKILADATATIDAKLDKASVVKAVSISRGMSPPTGWPGTIEDWHGTSRGKQEDFIYGLENGLWDDVDWSLYQLSGPEMGKYIGRQEHRPGTNYPPGSFAPRPRTQSLSHRISLGLVPLNPDPAAYKSDKFNRMSGELAPIPDPDFSSVSVPVRPGIQVVEGVFEVPKLSEQGGTLK